MSGNGSGYLWNNGGYARWTGGNGIISDGYLVFAWNGSGGAGSALYVNSSRQICQGTSSAHFKTNIEEISDAAWIYKLHPIKFDWKDQETHKAFGREIGLIAEDMLELEPLMTFWNDGNCTPSIMYEKLAVPMLVEMKKLHSRIEDLESQLTKLKAQGGD
jgi:hypothetical protein